MYRAKQRFHLPGDDDDDDDEERLFSIGEIKKDTSGNSSMNTSARNNANNSNVLDPSTIAFADRRRWGGPKDTTDPEVDLGDLRTDPNTISHAEQQLLAMACSSPKIEKNDGMNWQKITQIDKDRQQRLLLSKLQQEQQKKGGVGSSQKKKQHSRRGGAEPEDDFLPHQAVYGVPLKGDVGEERKTRVGKSSKQQAPAPEQQPQALRPLEILETTDQGSDDGGVMKEARSSLTELTRRAKEKVKGAYQTLNDIYDTNGERRGAQ